MTRSAAVSCVVLLLSCVGEMSEPLVVDAGSGGGAAGGAAGGGSAGGSAGGAAGGSAGGSAGGAAGGVAGGGTAGSSATPPPSDRWTALTSNLAGLASECGNMGAVFSSPHDDLLVTGVAQRGLWSVAGSAQQWSALGTTGAVITNRISAVVFDPASPDTFWESGIYNGGGVYKTTDRGRTFTQLGNIGHCDSVSVDFTDPARKTLLAGGHEQSRRLYLSTNGGTSWTDIGMTLPEGTGFCTATLVLDSATFVVGCGGWYGGTPGIYRSTDTGAHWTKVSDRGVIEQPLVASDGTLYWSGHQGGALLKSTDRGVTWVEVANGSNAGPFRPVELEDGRIVTATSGGLHVSANKGGTWQALGPALPYTPNAFGYSRSRRVFYVTRFTCAQPDLVPSDGIMQLGLQ